MTYRKLTDAQRKRHDELVQQFYDAGRKVGGGYTKEWVDARKRLEDFIRSLPPVENPQH